MTGRNIGIISHAQFLQPEEWHRVMIGHNGKLGVLSKSIQMFFELGASAFYLCSGIPKDDGNRKNSPDSSQYITTDFLHTLPFFKGAPEDVEWGLEKIRNSMLFDAVAQTTKEEAERAASFFKGKGVNLVVPVNPPKQIFRTHMESMLVKENGIYDENVIIMPVASDVDFDSVTLKDVVVIEKPHRVDAPPAHKALDKMARGILSVAGAQKGEKFVDFGRELGDLVRRYGGKTTWDV